MPGGHGRDNCHDYADDLQSMCDAQKALAQSRSWTNLDAVGEHLGWVSDPGQRAWELGKEFLGTADLVEKGYQTVKGLKEARGKLPDFSQLKAAWAAGKHIGEHLAQNVAYAAAWNTILTKDRALPGMPAMPGTATSRAFAPDYGVTTSPGSATNWGGGLFKATTRRDESEAANIIASTHATMVSANQRLFLAAPVAVLAGIETPPWEEAVPGRVGKKTLSPLEMVKRTFDGKGAISVVGMEMAQVTSGKVTEVHSLDSVLLTGKHLEAKTMDSVRVSTRELEVEAADRIDLVIRGPAGETSCAISASDTGVLIGVEGDGKVEVKAPEGEVSVSANAVTVDAAEKVVLNADNLEINCTNDITMKCASFSVDADDVDILGRDLAKVYAADADITLSGPTASLRAASSLELAGEKRLELRGDKISAKK